MPPPPQQLACPPRTSRVRMAMELSISPDIDIQQRPAVNRAAGRFQLVDDLHGADLRRSGNGPARKAAGQQIECVQPVGELAGDTAHQVMDIGVAFQREQLRDAHAADATAAAEIVAQQIDNHQVLGTILLAGQ